MTEKKNDFVVSARRRFGAEGEPLAGARVEEEDKGAPQAPPQPAAPQPAKPEATQAAQGETPAEDQMP